MEREIVSYEDICSEPPAPKENVHVNSSIASASSSVTSRYHAMPNGLLWDSFMSLYYDSQANVYLSANLQNLFHWDSHRQTFSQLESTRKYEQRLAKIGCSQQQDDASSSSAGEVAGAVSQSVKRKRDAEDDAKKQKSPLKDPPQEQDGEKENAEVGHKSNPIKIGDENGDDGGAKPFDPLVDATVPPKLEEMVFDSSLNAFFDRRTCLYFDPRSSLFFDYDRTYPAAVFHYCRITNEYMRVIQSVSDAIEEYEPAFGEDETAQVQPSAAARQPRDRFFLQCVKTNDDRYSEKKILLGETNSADSITVTIGRDKQNTISFSRDVETSNFHARIELQSVFWNTTVYISDVGSRNGTFLNGVRLSDTKVASEARQHILRDGDVIVIGRNELRLLREKIDEPSPEKRGTSTAGSADPLPSVNRLSNAERRKALMKLTAEERKQRRDVASQYEDRAGARRATINNAEFSIDETETKPHVPRVSRSNAGYRMLMSMGWQMGTGLGKESDGRQAPVKPVVVKGRQGLGFGS